VRHIRFRGTTARLSGAAVEDAVEAGMKPEDFTWPATRRASPCGAWPAPGPRNWRRGVDIMIRQTNSSPRTASRSTLTPFSELPVPFRRVDD